MVASKVVHLNSMATQPLIVIDGSSNGLAYVQRSTTEGLCSKQFWIIISLERGLLG
jgi:hypothetical protein